MNRRHIPAGWRRVSRALVVVLLGLWAVAQLAAVSAPLHHLIHPDSDAPEHTCLVASIAEGQVEAALTTVEPHIVPALMVQAPVAVPPPAFVPVLFQPPERAPPSPRA
ncbi:MAG: hypothetical protein H7A46_25750 [Verrucomicrobiales bacterium]|nr:hypothetical protein [Verrucomicrobiales bacterium]